MSAVQTGHRRDHSARDPERILRVVVVLYLLLGALYAAFTPAWQVPDEPAHYNYVRHVAEKGQLPELQIGDFPVTYLEEIKARGFPPGMDITPIRYESYQPPLYYVIAAPVYRLMRWLGLPMPLGLRAFSLALGAAAIVIGYWLVRSLYRHDALPALGTAALAATLPMRLSITAAVNNQVLAELVLNATVWRLVTMAPRDWTSRRAFVLGALLGLAILTSMQASVAFPVTFIALTWDTIVSLRSRRVFFLGPMLKHAAIMLGTAFLVALPWLIHNVSAYGPHDPLGMIRYHEVVATQPMMADYVAAKGWLGWTGDLIATTFRTFWGQFGWGNVLLDNRIYLSLALACGLAALYLGMYVWDMLRGMVDVAPQTMRGLVLVGVWAAFSTIGYLWSNIRSAEFQGWHLFSALVPWGLAWALGLRKLFQHPPLPILAMLAISVIVLFGASILTGNYQGFGIAALALAIVLIGLGHWLQSRDRGAPLALAHVSLAILSIVCLFGYIVPTLTP